ncbi:hypothetical protein PilKf_02624 [Pillotina sp. SPG140]
MGVSKVFCPLSVSILQNKHSRAAPAYLCGDLSAGNTSRSPGVIRHLEEQCGKVLVDQRRGFEIPVFDEPHLCHEFPENPLTFSSNDRGSLIGQGGLQDRFCQSDECGEFGYIDCRNDYSTVIAIQP